MSDHLGGAIPKFNWESNDLPRAWKNFVSHATFMFTGPLKEKSEAEKCNYLMLWVGDKGRDVYDTWAQLFSNIIFNLVYSILINI